MKYKFIKKIVLVVFFLCTPFLVTHATTGYSSYIKDVTVDEKNFALMYTKGSQDDMCAFEILRISLKDNTNITTNNCMQLYEKLPENSTELISNYRNFKDKLYKNSKVLKPIHLASNNINIAVEQISITKNMFSEEISSEYYAEVYHNGKSIGSLRFTGCSLDLVHIFTGYSIPNSNKLLIIRSGDGNCFEGGYSNETAHIVNTSESEIVNFIEINLDQDLHHGYQNAGQIRINLPANKAEVGGNIAPASKDDPLMSNLVNNYCVFLLGFLFISITLMIINIKKFKS